MFTRNVTLQLKPSSAQQFTSTVKNEILPTLRKQKGFRDELTLIAPERSEAVAISFWDTIQDAQAYAQTVYPEILKALSEVVEGEPKVETFELSNSTFHRIAVKGA